MSHLEPLLERNQRFAESGRHRGVAIMPRRQLFLITCLDPRVDPAAVLGLELGDAVVLRNAGGRVTPEVLLDLAFIATLGRSQVPQGPLFEVAVVHHTDCGTRALAVDGFRHFFAEHTGVDPAVLADRAVTDPEHTVRADVDRVRTSPWLSAHISVSGHVHDLDTGLVHTVLAAAPAGQSVATGAVS